MQQRLARQAEDRAREEANTAFAKEMRIRQQLEQLDAREAEAISVEEANIENEEFSEFLATDPSDKLLTLSPSTWGLMEDQGYDLSSEFWRVGPSLPEALTNASDPSLA